jgi:hypothetical protein
MAEWALEEGFIELVIFTSVCNSFSIYSKIKEPNYPYQSCYHIEDSKSQWYLNVLVDIRVSISFRYIPHSSLNTILKPRNNNKKLLPSFFGNG